MMFIILFIITKAATCLAELNVALRKSGTVCSREEPIFGIVDGNRNTNFVIYMNCSHSPFIEVFFGAMYYIHYTSLYRNSKITESSNSLQSYRVSLKVKDVARSQYCGDSVTFKQETNFLVINCIMSHQQYSEARLVLSVNVASLNLAEFEVYSLTSETHPEVTVVHRGCFKELLPHLQVRLQNGSNCFSLCAEAEYSVAAMMMDDTNVSECYCSNDFNRTSEVPMKECKRKCGTRGDFCGGVSRYSVYIVMIQLPHYIGCMGFVNVTLNETVRTISKNMTISKCLQSCDSSRFALLKNRDQCICSNISREGAECRCTAPCSGDKLQVCGDLDCVSVYGTCLRGDVYTLKCSKMFNCLRDHNEHGLCNNGECLPGFSGRHCIERSTTADECHVYNPCDLNARCEVIDDGVTKCTCNYGYYENLETGECIYADESTIFFIIFLLLTVIVLFATYWSFSTKRKGLLRRESVLSESTTEKDHSSRRPSLYNYKMFPQWLIKGKSPSTVSSGTASTANVKLSK